MCLARLIARLCDDDSSSSSPSMPEDDASAPSSPRGLFYSEHTRILPPHHSNSAATASTRSRRISASERSLPCFADLSVSAAAYSVVEPGSLNYYSTAATHNSLFDDYEYSTARAWHAIVFLIQSGKNFSHCSHSLGNLPLVKPRITLPILPPSFPQLRAKPARRAAERV
jgi:hypothetical protein